MNFTSDTLNQIFTNNIEFVAKQFQVIVDTLFPDSDDNSDAVVDTSKIPVLTTGQVRKGLGAKYVGNVRKYAYGYYNVQINSMSDSEQAFFLGLTSDSAPEIEDWAVERATQVKLHSLNLGTDGYGHVLRGTSNVFGIYRYGTTTEIPYYFQFVDTVKQPVNLRIYYNTVDSNSNLSLDTATAQCYIKYLSDSRGIVFTPDIPTAQNIYNNYTNYYNDYHVDHTFNFNSGDVYVGGAAGGLVVGLAGGVAYADIELALDSLIGELNINLSDSNKLPIQDFPSYLEVKYGDMGDFNITPIEQIKQLPVAPDIEEVTVDPTDYFDMLGHSLSGFVGIVDGLGLSTMLAFTVIAVFIINKLRGD